MKTLKLSAVTAIVLALALASASRSAVESQTIQEAPTTDLNVLTDDLFNGLGARGTPIDECVSGPPVANCSFEDNKFIFEEREVADDGLGPTYNDVACVACHQSPDTGGISQTNELRAGHLNSSGVFTNPFDGNGGTVENNALGASVAAFDTVADPEDGGEDAEAFANFMRATRAPGRGPITAQVQNGQTPFNQISCNICHTPSIVTAPAGTLVNGGAFTVPAVLGDERIRPFSDFLLHNIGTGDGIVQNGGAATRNMVRTPPLWGVRMRPLLMHDGLSFTFNETIQRHARPSSSEGNNQRR